MTEFGSLRHFADIKDWLRQKQITKYKRLLSRVNTKRCVRFYQCVKRSSEEKLERISKHHGPRAIKMQCSVVCVDCFESGLGVKVKTPAGSVVNICHNQRFSVC